MRVLTAAALLLLSTATAEARHYLFPTDNLSAGKASGAVVFQGQESRADAADLASGRGATVSDRQNSVSASVAYGLTDRVELSATMPYLINSRETYSSRDKAGAFGGYRLAGKLALSPGVAVIGAEVVPGGIDRSRPEVATFAAVSAPPADNRPYFGFRAENRGDGRPDTYTLALAVESRLPAGASLEYGAAIGINANAADVDPYRAAEVFVAGRLALSERLYVLPQAAALWTEGRDGKGGKLVAEEGQGYRAGIGFYYVF